MYRYVIKRVLFLIPTILGVTFIIFFVMGLTPGNPGRMILGPTAKQEAIDTLNHGQGGCEPGIIIDKLPDMDALGLAPTSRGAHTTRERFYIETVEPTYQLFVRMLRQIAENGI